MIKSNLIPTRWVAYKLENNNAKEGLPLFESHVRLSILGI